MIDSFLLVEGLKTYLIGLVGGSIYMYALVTWEEKPRAVGVTKIIKHILFYSMLSLAIAYLYFLDWGYKIRYQSILSTHWITAVAMSFVCLANSFFLFGFLRLKKQMIKPFPLHESFWNTLLWWKNTLINKSFLWIWINVALSSLYVFQFEWSMVCGTIGMITAILFSGVNELKVKPNDG